MSAALDLKVLEKIQHHTNLVLGELLPSILAHCTTTELLNLRLISRTWEKEARQVLIKREDLNLPFVYCPHYDPPTFVRYIGSPGVFYCCPRFEALVYPETTASVNDDLPNGRKTIAEFTKLFQTSLNLKSCERAFFPRQFRFRFLFEFLDPPEVSLFFQTFGESIKELHLDNFHEYYLGQEGWGSKCILKYLPNLEKLTINIGWIRHFGSDGPRQTRISTVTNTDEIVVPNFHWLKHLVVYLCDIKVIEEVKVTPLLTRAKNLESVRCIGMFFPPGITSTLYNLQKINLLRLEELQIDLGQLLSNDPEVFGNLEMLTSASSGSLELRQIYIFSKIPIPAQSADVNAPDNNFQTIIWRRALFILVKLLAKNKDSLKRISIGKDVVWPLWTNPGFLRSLPTLCNVSKMDFSCQGQVYENFYFSGQRRDQSDIFPGVQSLQIDWQDKHLDSFPFFGETFPTVKILQMSFRYGFDPRVLYKLPGTFPCLDTLTLFDIRTPEFVAHVGELWKLESLAEISLSISPGPGPQLESLENTRDVLFPLGTALLGIEMKTLEKTHENWEKTGVWKISDDESPKNILKPSIFNLTNLKRFHLRVVGFDGRLCMFFAGFIGQLCMDKMADLQVKLTVHHLWKTREEQTVLKQELSAPLARQFPNVHLEIA